MAKKKSRTNLETLESRRIQVFDILTFPLMILGRFVISASLNLAIAVVKIFKLLSLLLNLILWMLPFALIIVGLAVPRLIWKGITYDQYLELLKIVIWPSVFLVGLFFFRKLLTYLTFSINEFNVFGAKGNLKDIHQVIAEGVQRQLDRIKAEEDSAEELKRFKEFVTHESEDEKKKLLEILTRTHEQLMLSNNEIENLKRGNSNSGKNLAQLMAENPQLAAEFAPYLAEVKGSDYNDNEQTSESSNSRIASSMERA